MILDQNHSEERDEFELQPVVGFFLCSIMKTIFVSHFPSLFLPVCPMTTVLLTSMALLSFKIINVLQLSQTHIIVSFGRWLLAIL